MTVGLCELYLDGNEMGAMNNTSESDVLHSAIEVQPITQHALPLDLNIMVSACTLLGRII